MSYHIYTTKGLVLSARPLREADRIYSILTSDFGLIRASAVGVRKSTSKLRGNLEPHSLSTVSLVKGKEYWRITSAVLEYSLPAIFKSNPAILRAFARVLALLEKLLAGESAHPELIEKIEEVVDFVRDAQDTGGVDASLPELVEILLVARILFELGYLSRESVPEGILEGPPQTQVLEVISKEKKVIVKVINEGLQSSGLVQ